MRRERAVTVAQMERLLQLVATLTIVSTARPLWAARVVISKTTLVEPWRWGFGALCVWAATLLLTAFVPNVSPGLADQLWLASTVLLVTPFVSVLGARRPASRVWSWFVALPVTIVLLLPAATAWNSEWRPAPLQLEPPMLAGYGLVLLMGTGNYLGTRYGQSALLCGLAGLSVVVSLSTIGSRLPVGPNLLRAFGTLLLSVAMWQGWWRSHQPGRRTTDGFDRLWLDFRDLFGVVWARRIQERFNETAKKSGWPVRLQLDGFVGDQRAVPSASSSEPWSEIEAALRWLLRRFVDPEWIDERLLVKS